MNCDALIFIRCFTLLVLMQTGTYPEFDGRGTERIAREIWQPHPPIAQQYGLKEMQQSLMQSTFNRQADGAE